MHTEKLGGFTGLGLDERLIATLTALGYEEPTPIQREAIPPLLAGRDVLGHAATGTGKTAAFALPLLQRIAEQEGARGHTSALVLVPTRELAMQVADAVHKYGRALGISVLPIYGGQAIGQQLRALRSGRTRPRLLRRRTSRAPAPDQYDFGSPSECIATKLRIISRLTGAIRVVRAATRRPATPYSWVMPLQPWVCTATSAAWQAASPAAYLAMLAASPAPNSSPAS